MRTKQIYHEAFDITRMVVEPADWLPPTPNSWRVIQISEDGAAYGHQQADGKCLVVILSACVEDDGNAWAHLSLSKRTSGRSKYRRMLPSWEELKYVKDAFAGRDRCCVQVLPAEKDFINLGEVLHLWWRLDGVSVVPDFTSGTGSI